MPEYSAHAHGTFCWAELATTDPEAAKAFYCELFGWEFHDDILGPERIYTMLQRKGHNVGALYRLNPQQAEQGVPPHWIQYVSVEDLDAALAQARATGGESLFGPCDILDIGRMGVLRDPQGAYLSLWQPLRSIGAQLKNEHGSMCWNELMTRDVGEARAFYERLFGWKARIQEFGGTPYTSYMRGEEPVAGMMAIDPQWGEVPPHWLLYWFVDHCDPVAERARALGGSTEVGPQDIPGVGRFAITRDPQGAHFGIVSGPGS